MALDQTKNFCEVEVSIGYNDTDATIVLKAGEGANLPDPTSGEYNLVWYDSTTYPNPTDDPNVEIIRVTALSTDTLTVTRNQESSGASTKNTADKTYKMILSLTKKMVDDIASEIAGAGYTNLTSFVDQNNWKVFYSDGSGDVKELALGADGEVLTSTGAAGVPAFEAPAGGGGAFTLDTGVVRQDVSGSGAYATDDFVFGSPTLDDEETADHDRRMFFDKSNGSFRAGRATGTQWDEGSRGYCSTAFGYENTSSGTCSIALGGVNTASGPFSFATGYGAFASADSSTAFGNSSATGNKSFALGDSNEASGVNSIALGWNSHAYLYCQQTHAAKKFTVVGDAQYSRLVLRADTTDATPEVMYIGGYSTIKPILPASTAWRVDAYVIATTEDCALSSSWTVKGVIHRDDADNTEVIWSSVTEDYDGIDTAAVVTMTADDTNEALEINITGKAATNIRWVATVNLTEVGY